MRDTRHDVEKALFSTVELSDPAFECEGLRLLTVKSPALRQRSDVMVWVPEATHIHTLLILLHGVYGSHWVWSHKAGAHRVAKTMMERGDIQPLVIAMPSDGLMRDGSAYLRWPAGQDVERWIVEEVPIIARLAAPCLSRDAKVAIAGLSMGGFGALRLGAKYPEIFSAISAHSAITRIDELASFVSEDLEEYAACGTPGDLSPLHWMRQHRDLLPPVRFDCGMQDDLLTSNRDLHEALQQDGISHEYNELPGTHEWSYWQSHFYRTLLHVNRHCSQEER